MTDASSDLNDPCSRNHSCTPTRDSARKVSNASGRGLFFLAERKANRKEPTAEALNRRGEIVEVVGKAK